MLHKICVCDNLIFRSSFWCGEVALVALCGEVAPVALCGEVAPVALCGEVAPVALCGEVAPVALAANTCKIMWVHDSTCYVYTLDGRKSHIRYQTHLAMLHVLFRGWIHPQSSPLSACKTLNVSFTIENRSVLLFSSKRAWDAQMHWAWLVRNIAGPRFEVWSVNILKSIFASHKILQKVGVRFFFSFHWPHREESGSK